MLLILLLALCACGMGGMDRYQASFFDVFDTQTMVTGYAESEEEFTATAQLVHEELIRYHQLFDIYHTYEGINNIKTINDQAGGEPIVVDPAIIELLELAKAMYEKTDGMVNAAMGSVLSVWHEYREAGIDDPLNAKLPAMELLEERNQHTDIDDVLIDKAASTVCLRDPQMSLDVGSIGKGFAVQKAAELLKEQNINNVIISAGGNVYAVGTRPDNSPWTVGIQNPDTESAQPIVATVAVSDMAVVSSGSYQRYYTVDGVNYHHIINPKTLMPKLDVVSLSVITTDSGVADALSTALFNMEPQSGIALIESLPDTEALYIMSDDSEHYSSGYKSYLSK